MTYPGFIESLPDDVVLLSNTENRCATFFRPLEKEFYVGYRFLEDSPETSDSITISYDQHPLGTTWDLPASSKPPLRLDPAVIAGRDWLTMYQETQGTDSERLGFQSFEDGSALVEISEFEGRLDLELYFEPEETGIRIWLKARTTRQIDGSYCLQQCLRFTGGMNASWRTRIAHVPYLSEFDMHAMGRPNATLTYVRREGTWSQLPVQYTVVPTKGWDKMSHGTAQIQCDHGLIVRESPHREEAPQWYWDRVAPGTNWKQIAAGLYWERTAKVSNRHPADCVHAWVDIGPLAEGQIRIVRGKVYYLEGSKDELLAEWQRDFPSTG